MFVCFIQLYVYNVEADLVREVTLTPDSNWGGKGCLGCDIGYCYLYHIPFSVDRSKVPQIGEGGYFLTLIINEQLRPRFARPCCQFHNTFY
jgi:hypothetical protein